MNVRELGIYTALQNTPEQYRITDEGTRLWVLEYNVLVCLKGEKLDEMHPKDLYEWYQYKLREYKIQNGWR